MFVVGWKCKMGEIEIGRSCLNGSEASAGLGGTLTGQNGNMELLCGWSLLCFILGAVGCCTDV